MTLNLNESHSRKTKFNSVLLFLVVILQNPIWPMWAISPAVLSFIIVIILFFINILQGRFSKISPLAFIVFISSFLFFFVFSIVRGEGARISSLITLLAFLIVSKTSEIEKHLTIKYITNYIALIIAISLPFYLIHIFFSPTIPLIGMVDLSDFKGAPMIMENYVLYVMPAGFDYFRFYSMFDEPGVLGTISAFILYINNYNFRKKSNIIILLGSIFTYSMAFYILTLVGFTFNMIRNRQIKGALTLIIFIFILFFIVKDQVAFQYSVMSRFSSGVFDALKERNDDVLDSFFQEYIGSIDFLLGKGALFLKQSAFTGNSYKFFLIEYGLIGILLILLIYLSLIKKMDSSIFVLLVLFILSFLQRSFIFTAWQIIIFSCGAYLVKQSFSKCFMYNDSCPEKYYHNDS